MSAAPDTCAMCRAPKGHREAACLLCGLKTKHIGGIYGHLPSVHGIAAGTRPHMLLMDAARAIVREWPLEAPWTACRAARLEVLRLDIFL